jgi:thiamine-phosphate pyrophosphorylase
VKFQLPKIYPITDAKISNLTHVQQVKLFIKAGAKIIQLREKYATSAEFYEQAKLSIETAKKHKVKIIINDRVDIALTSGADGVHLGQNDLPPKYARKILGENSIIGYSTHTIDQAIEASKLPIDYLAFGPIFPTTSKENPEYTVGTDEIIKVREAIGEFPLVAIGGINLDNFQTVFECGADSIALISELLSEPQKIAEKFTKFKV